MPRAARARRVPRPFELHWGRGQIVEEATCRTPYHAPAIQLLEFEDGSLSVRFCYFDHAGRFQRSPLMIGESDLAALRASLVTTPRLRKLLRRLAGISR
jgi:hypothetical protein